MIHVHPPIHVRTQVYALLPETRINVFAPAASGERIVRSSIHALCQDHAITVQLAEILHQLHIFVTVRLITTAASVRYGVKNSMKVHGIQGLSRLSVLSH